MSMKECFISVDIETTGPTPGDYSMYEIGAYVCGLPRAEFSCKVQLLMGASYDSDALHAVGVKNIDALKNRRGQREPEEAMQRFAAWVNSVARGKRPVFVANNAPFDWMFVAWYFEHYDIALQRVENPFGHSALDMKAYFMELTGCSWKEATLANMAKHTGVAFAQLPHKAIEDARIQGEIFAKLIQLTKGNQ